MKVPFGHPIISYLTIALILIGGGLVVAKPGYVFATPGLGFGEASTDQSSPPYGPAITMDGLANMQVGGDSSGEDNTYVAFRFRAQLTGKLISFRGYWLGADRPGYGGGTGGTIRISLESDSNGVPSGEVLAAYVYANPSSGFQVIEFPDPANLTEGDFYHLVFSNIDPNPTTNFVSVNTSYVDEETPTPLQDRGLNREYATLERYSEGTWELQPDCTPIMDLEYENGYHQGQGYMEVEVLNELAIEGDSLRARQRFTFRGAEREVSNVAIRVGRNWGDGDIEVVVRRGTGDILAATSIPATRVPILDPDGDTAGVWISGELGEPLVLSDGHDYSLVLSTHAGTSLWSRGIQEGIGYGFHESTYFSEGHVEVSSNGGRTWTTVSGLSKWGDLQFYLH